MDGRLGVALSASYNANYVQQDRVQTDWSYLADGRVIPYQVMWRPGPKKTGQLHTKPRMFRTQGGAVSVTKL